MVGIVERFLSHAGKFGVRKDLFGLFDLIAVNTSGEERGIYGIQVFTTAWKEHYDKFFIENREEAIKWLQAGGIIELWGWRKLKNRWVPRIEVITLKDYDEEKDQVE